MTVVSAPPGSGKTVLLRSWISESSLAERAAWVPVGRDERDPQRFWLAVLGALRQTSAGSGLVRELTAAPDLDGWAVVERLLTDLAPLQDRLWLVVDDLHELGSDQARRQLELLVLRAPAELRFVLATRHDVRLGLHRLRLEGELAEIRADDLRFSVDEARALFAAAGVELTGLALGLLYERTEGWAAGLRLAALSLAGHPDPARFAAEFSGTERTVAEYLLAEVLERQPGEVRRLLLRTSGLERVNGELADLLTGGSGGERVLQDLEEANAFVVSLDAARSCPEPGQTVILRWGEGGGAWPGRWARLGSSKTGRQPMSQAAYSREAYADAERYLGLAERGLASVPEGRRGQAQVLLGVVRLLVARRHGNLPAVAEQAQRLQALAEAPDAAHYDLAPAAQAAWATSCARLRWSKSATARPGQADLIKPSRTWTRGSRWRAGSGGPISSSWAWCTGRRSSSTGPSFRGRRSAAGRRSTWQSGTAGPTIRTLATPL